MSARAAGRKLRVLLWYRGAISLGVEYVSAALKAAGHETELLYEPGADNSFYYRWEAMKPLNRHDRLLRRALAFRPDLIAMGAVTNIYPYACEMAARLKAALPEVPIVIGGIHATSVPEYVIENPHFDIVARGECDDAIVELADRMARGEPYWDVRNFWFKADGAVVRNELRPPIEDLDRLPYPDKDLFRKVGAFGDMLYILGGRGCPYKCTFCESHMVEGFYHATGDKFTRRRDPVQVVEECNHWLDRFGRRFKMFYFVDGSINYDLPWFKEFLKVYRDHCRFPFLSLTYANEMDEETARLMREAGCIRTVVGMESGSERMRNDVLKKGVTNDQLRRAVRMIQGAGVDVQITAMFGLPGETPAEMFETLDMVRDLRPSLVTAYTLYPYMNTGVQRQLREEGLLDEKSVELARRGESSCFEEGILYRHPHIRQAMVFTKLITQYNAAPFWLKPVIRGLIALNRPTLSRWIHLATTPLLCKTTGLAQVRDFLRSIWLASFGYPEIPQRLPGETGKEPAAA